MLTTIAITIGAFAIAMLIMAVGVIFRNRCLRGSCGGPEVLDPKGDPITCGACPRRKDHSSAPALSATGLSPSECELHEQKEETVGASRKHAPSPS